MLKIGRRRLSWIVLGILILVSASHGRELRTELLDYRQAERTGVGRFGQAIPLEAARSSTTELTRRMTYPGFLDELWVVTDWGVLAVLILASLQTGEEFEGGTARTILIRGGPRRWWPVAKVLAILGWTGLAWLLLALANLVVGLWTQAQAGGQWGMPPLDAAALGGHFMRLVRSWLATIPYAAFGVAAAVLARGAGPALALGIGARFVEIVSNIAGAFLLGAEWMGYGTLHAWYRIWAPLHVMSFEWNARVWSGSLSPILQAGLEPAGPGGGPPAWPSHLHTNAILAAAILLFWSVFWIALAAWTLQRRDVGA
jgi:hypothetical protein